MSEHRDRLMWRHSSFCNNGACVEVADGPVIVHMRDSKDPTGGRLTFSRAGWAGFIAEAKAGKFDLPASG
jgi:hypothetical protein